jgi:A/G-specific adenine glycosylase
VLAAWSGLGYNRRALWLHQAAQIIVADHEGRVPPSMDTLRHLPGVGRSTAAAVCVFAFDQPQAFIETNIRSAFINFFFPDEVSVADAAILPLVEQTLDRDRPREWYYALMDYGVWVKKTHANPGRRSKHHTVQTPFAGSRRELRAQVLQALLRVAPLAADVATISELLPEAGRTSAAVAAVLEQLTAEGFLSLEGGRYRIA